MSYTPRSPYFFHLPIPTRWRFVRLLLLIVVVFSLLSVPTYIHTRPPYEFYSVIQKHETSESRRLIINNPESKYVLFKQLQGAGFNNQEILLYHHLSLLTSRIYAYQPLVWRPRGEKATVPLSAFLSGVAQNSISSETWEDACSKEDLHHVHLRTTSGEQWKHVKTVLSGNAKCIVVDDWIFNWDFLASPALHAIWPSFHTYLSKHFQWSDPILGITARTQIELRLLDPHTGLGNPYLALHFRRGDFDAHCLSLSSTHTGFTTWATLPILQAQQHPPLLDTTNATSIMDHCYPPLSRLLALLDSVLAARPDLRTVHILHDGAWDHPLVYYQLSQLARALTSRSRAEAEHYVGGPVKRVTHSGGAWAWGLISGVRGSSASRGWSENDWSAMVDVELARRAEVFVGNGYSSLSTQVVALRLGADNGSEKDIILI